MASEQAREKEWELLAISASQVFSPGAPINARDLFSGRQKQIRQVVDAVNQAGQHALLFGERGVGKTSLSRVIRQYLADHPQVVTPSINCETSDTFDSVWRKVFNRLDVSMPGWPVMGFSNAGRQTDIFKVGDALQGVTITVDVVRDQLEQLASRSLPIIIFDEFDRLKRSISLEFADTIKSLADNSVGVTILLVGVGDSADQLVEDHQSVGRNLKQIQVPRMSEPEIAGIITKGLTALGMTVAVEALNRIVLLSRGLPHYAHLIGLHSARAALDVHSLEVDIAAVNRGVETAIEDAQQTIRSAYIRATESAKKKTLFHEVLLACALAQTDERGCFGAADVRAPLRKITGKNYDIPNFAQHLSEFSDSKRGKILRKDGGTRPKYRFSDPLMQPHVVMEGLRRGLISERPGTLSLPLPTEP